MSDPVVVAARLYQVALPLRTPFTISGGTMTVRRSLIVELTDSSGRTGYGESAPFERPFYSAETLASARACLSELLLSRLLGQPVSHVARAHELLSRDVVGNRMARAGAETAWWDLWAARHDISLADAVERRLAELGIADGWRERRPWLDCGVALGIPPDLDGGVLREWVGDALRHGYRRVKLKVRPGWDVEPVRLAREEMRRAGRDVPLWVDANGAYRPEQVAELDALDRLDLLFLEQPLPEEAIWDSCELARRIRTPVCLDESLVSDETARQVIAMNGPAIWNVKVQRVGGLDEACRIYARAVGSGVRLWGGTMPETGVGAQAMLALGCHAGFVFPSDIEPSERWYPAGTDLIELVMTAEGRMAVPDQRPPVRLPPDAQLVATVGGP